MQKIKKYNFCKFFRGNKFNVELYVRFSIFLLRQEPQITICLKVSADAKTKNLNLVNGISLILNYMSSLNLIYLDLFDIYFTFLRLKL